MGNISSSLPVRKESSINNGFTGIAQDTPTGSSKLKRSRTETHTENWAVTPRVLVVEDDLVARGLSRKFLQVTGCAIDVAEDGLKAVDKMKSKKYDLVLMDIMMPRLDGISATTLIRKFDQMTPIISMTTNSKPAEVETYYSNGVTN
ncbi:CheY-like superfamily [Cantharellus anzutake]|uniref:CheY-like superfamily n=1 Tax=Cantharellus anzutake TaxID=1750568 RepID=UPI001906C739|nr:CheY-like superfamily [Cantharellus anzutake]KAF8337425.1 CheY-like superfamily [Cantharellus anzutake]